MENGVPHLSSVAVATGRIPRPEEWEGEDDETETLGYNECYQGEHEPVDY